MRTFIAIELDAAMQEALGRALHDLQSASPPVTLKWVSPENQHLTLHFFGELAVARVSEVEAVLREAVRGSAPFELTLAERGCFPNAHRPNVLWVGVHEPSGALARLHTALNAHLSRIGFKTEARPFAPHLTLARVPRHVSPRERRQLGEWFMRQPPPGVQGMRVAQVHLIQSELLPAGPKYTTLDVAALSADMTA